MGGKFSNLIQKDGFYIILFICVCIVATTAVWVSRNNLKKMDELNEKNILEKTGDIDDEEFLAITDEEEDDYFYDVPTLELSKIKIKEMERDDEEEKNKKQQDSGDEKEDTKPSASSGSKVAMGLPIKGSKGLNYAGDTLVYSKTLEEWTTHTGIDIKAQEGEIVRASENGVIKEINEDDLWGIVITIDHGNGLTTKYAYLSAKDMVKVGQQVQKGDAIGKVGKGKGMELCEGPHLHFEVLKDGKHMNPNDYLTDIE